MKILHILSNRWNSAITEYAVRSAQSLKNFHHKQTVWCLESTPAIKRFSNLNIKVEGQKNFLPSFQRLKNIQTHKADVIITYGGPEEILAQISGHHHIIRFLGDQRISKKTKYFLSHIRTTSIVTPSQIISDYTKNLDSNPNRIHTLPLGLDAAEFKSQHFPTTPKVLIFGRLDPVKGHLEFLDMFKKGFEHGLPQNTTLQIIGEEKNIKKQDIIDKSNKLGIHNNVEIITKRIEDRSHYMGETTLGVISSLGSEVICRVAQEFLMCGCPTLNSGVGSLEETLLDTSYGASWKDIEPQNRGSFFAKTFLNFYQESKEKRISRSQNAKYHFGLETFGEKWNQLISQ